MGKAPKTDGRILERATAFIHKKLLENDPNFKTANFTIESRKMVKVKGVPYEVDVLVTTAPDSLYKSTVIFECKDWKRPVDTEKIGVLGNKVAALGANRGILVARKITKGARALLEQDSRLSFVQCSSDFHSPLDGLELFHSFHDFFPLIITLKERGVAGRPNPDVLDLATVRCIYNGRAVDFSHYMEGILNEFVERDRKENRRKYHFEGNHWGQSGIEIRYEPGELVINEKEIEMATVRLTFWVEVCRQKIISKFELEKQGRAFFFEPLVDSVTGETYQVEMVQLL